MKKITIILLGFIVAFCVLTIKTQKRVSMQKDIDEIIWQGKTFRKGDRVKINEEAGVFSTQETKHRMEIIAAVGKTGTVIRGVNREANQFINPKPDEPIQMALIKWDKQEWNETIDEDSPQYIDENDNFTPGRKVKLKSFEAVIHADYLDVIPKTSARTRVKSE